jgi:hypothetical protein
MIAIRKALLDLGLTCARVVSIVSQLDGSGAGTKQKRGRRNHDQDLEYAAQGAYQIFIHIILWLTNDKKPLGGRAHATEESLPRHISQ